MINNELTRDFEKYFSLPWETTKEKDIVFIKGQDWDIPVVIAEGSITECAEREALQYAVQCANLMPEAVELLKAAQETMNEACTVCAEDLGERCATCDREEIDCRITAFLSKLEGGADDERD